MYAPPATNPSRDGGKLAAAQRTGMPVGLCLVQLALAYEWLISGINKLVNLHFTVQLASTLKQSMDGNPYSWYVDFLREIVLPHATLFGVLTELGETAIGVTLLASAVLWIWRPQSRLTISAGRAACLALGGAAFLSLNYFFQGGSPLPWVSSANAFNEGVDIDILIPLVCAALLVANLSAVRAVATEKMRSGAHRTMSWVS